MRTVPSRPVRLFHFSEQSGIERFVPRPVTIPPERGEGRAWLNGPLVWAIDEWHSPMYLFPRDCPRILLWPLTGTTSEDRARWLGDSRARMIAHVERDWWDRLRAAAIHRYEVPAERFESIDDAGMYVSRSEVEPLAMETLRDLPAALTAANVELRVLDDLTPLRGAWATTLHASGLRLSYANGWRT